MAEGGISEHCGEGTYDPPALYEKESSSSDSVEVTRGEVRSEQSPFDIGNHPGHNS